MSLAWRSWRVQRAEESGRSDADSDDDAGARRQGRSWARIASLIETCKLNGVDPLAYLTKTLEALANGYPQHRIDDLLPWSYAGCAR